MKPNISELPQGAHIHIMGICGTAMGNFAGLLQGMGYKITGSDQNIYPPMSEVLQNLGIEIYQGYKKENLNPRPDFVVVGNVISKNMEEAQALLASDIPYASFPESIGDMLLKNTHSIVVCGTHGKTTTSSMMAWIGNQLDLDPGYLIGGVPKNFERSFSKGSGNYFIIEGDEYDTAFFDKVPKFKHYHPQSAILTSVEFDHADIYNNLDDVLDAFKILMEKIPAEGRLIYHYDDKNIKSLLKHCRSKNLHSYGFGSEADFKIENLRYEPELTVWDVVYNHNQKQTKVGLQSKMSGDHNVLNFTANFALAVKLGWDMRDCVQSIKNFEGVKRRQEILGEPGGVLVIEDFAHHPTAVASTLKGLKQKYTGRRLVAVFEPRSATSRKDIFQEDYYKAFVSQADLSFIMQAFQPNNKSLDPQEGFSSEKLVNDLIASGKKATLGEDYEALVKQILSQVTAGDVLVLMSNGGFGGIYSKILQGLK